MKIEFELVNNQEIKIIAEHNGEKKQVGHIFSPASSNCDISDAIQICGFTEAYDLWGCARYQTYKLDETGLEYVKIKPKIYKLPPAVFEMDSETRNKVIELTRNQNIAEGKIAQEFIKIQTKDIQLKFPFPSESFKTPINWNLNINEDCHRCFNSPCTCENKGKHNNPFDVKRASDLILVKEDKK